MAPLAAGRAGVTVHRRDVHIGIPRLPGELAMMPNALGLVIFAHGSSSNRRSPRNRFVAEVMHRYQLATLLFDLLTEAECGDRQKSFDIALLDERLTEALAWHRGDAETAHLRVGLFGASTGAAAALQSAAAHPAWVAAVVSRGGRADLAQEALPAVQAPTLLIVGGSDVDVLQLNRSALRALKCATRLEVVPGATHLFEEPGAIETVAHLAGSWFATYLPAVRLR